jgi:tetratricopeptide (TPR) repeat protein
VLGTEFDELDLDPDALLPDLDALDIDPDVEFGGGHNATGALHAPTGRAGSRAPGGNTGGRPMLVTSAPAAGDDELMSFDELDAVDLGDGEMAAASNDPYVGTDATVDADDNPEMIGAIRFNEAETALGNGEHPRAVALLEEAYDNGFDVAELHAMLAYARFMASGGDLETAQHAFELLEYAQQMDPSLDLVHAYRGAIHKTLGQLGPAREALGRALELNPYCELAIQLMDQL